MSTGECSCYAGRIKTFKSNWCHTSSSTFLGVLPFQSSHWHFSLLVQVPWVAADTYQPGPVVPGN